jgi:hypothetical protein
MCLVVNKALFLPTQGYRQISVSYVPAGCRTTSGRYVRKSTLYGGNCIIKYRIVSYTAVYNCVRFTSPTHFTQGWAPVEHRKQCK